MLPLPYATDKFVDRDKEIEAVLAKARQLSEEKEVRERTIVFQGYKGSGKTWLLKEMHENRLKELPGVQSFYIDLAAADTEIASQFALVEQSVNNVNQVVAILLDYVYEAGDEKLKEFEVRFLEPLTHKPRALIVMAGRGKAHVWKAPQLRIYTDEIPLESFNEPDFTLEQLRRQQPDAASRATAIHKLSGGYPYGSYLLAATPDEVAALEQAASALLFGVSSPVRERVEALCVLNGFDEDRMPALLATYYDDPAWGDRPFKEMRAVRDGLLHARLANWDESLGGWVIDGAVRKIVEEYLKLAQPVKWQALHRAAYCLFDGWQRQYPSERERWRAQADYHCACLTDAGYNRPVCPDGKTES